jgi:hypothetical protein
MALEDDIIRHQLKTPLCRVRNTLGGALPRLECFIVEISRFDNFEEIRGGLLASACGFMKLVIMTC